MITSRERRRHHDAARFDFSDEPKEALSRASGLCHYHAVMTASSHSARLLRTKRYGVFCSASLLSNVGTWMQSVAEPWLLPSIGGSSFLLGLDVFAMNAPFWILALLGGILADRKDRTLIIYVFQGIQMLCPVFIIALVVMGWIKVWMIIAVSLVVGVTDALSAPAFSSLIPSIVSRDDLISHSGTQSIITRWRR